VITPRELQKVANAMCRQAKVAAIGVEVREVRRGRARPRTGRVTVPTWALDLGRAYALYYVIHEVVHLLIREARHTPRFHETEVQWLVQYGMRPVYRRAYPKQMWSLDGVLLWEFHGRRRSKRAAGEGK
jgi:hypothetical protein